MPSQKDRKPRFGDAWKSVKSTPEEMDDLFSKFVKGPVDKEAKPPAEETKPISIEIRSDRSLEPTQSTENLVPSELSSENQVLIEPSSTSIVPTEPSSNSSVPIEPGSNRTVLSEPSPIRTKPQQNQVGGHYITPNKLDDEIMPTLPPYEQIILRRLLRLSWGFNRFSPAITDPVSYTRLAEKCSLSVSTVKRALQGLEQKGKVRPFGTQKHNPSAGNQYEILIEYYGLIEPSPSRTKLSEPGPNRTKFSQNSIKDHDHEDLNNTISDHLKAVTTIYEKITGNSWKATDLKSYQQIKHVSVEQIEQGIRRAAERAKSHPGSLAFFTKEILTPSLGQPKATERQRAQLKRIVDEVSKNKVGAGSEYTEEHFRRDVERACNREGVIFDLDLYMKIIGT
jgi:hypothetical protein